MANQVVWAARSDNASFNARYSPGRITPGQALQASASAAPLYEADANAIGGNRWNMSRSVTLNRGLVYPARDVFAVRTFSILLRLQLGTTGLLGLFDIAGGAGLLTNRFAAYFVTNDWRVTGTQENGASTFSGPTLISSAPSTSAYIDVVWTWDGTTTANALKLWLDGVNIASATAGAAWASSFNPNLIDYICLGGVAGGVFTVNMYVNEMVIWNYVITPTSVGLVSGTGSLNGASRTSFVDVASLNGFNNTDPGIANVRLATAYVISGVDKVGTAAIPTAANVKTGVATDATTGTYDGSDRWTDPGAANVRLATAYKANSLTNNQTGTLNLPPVADVRLGVSFDATTKTGTVRVPAVGKVESGYAYDASDSLVGTLVAGGGGLYTDPGVANVRLNTQYQFNSGTNNRTGTLDLTTASNIREGVTQDNGAIVGTLSIQSEEIFVVVT